MVIFFALIVFCCVSCGLCASAKGVDGPLPGINAFFACGYGMFTCVMGLMLLTYYWNRADKLAISVKSL